MLLEQDYPGALSVIVVDDHSGDGTATVVDEIARGKAARGRLTIIQSDPLPAGWAGKVWALAQGVSASAIVPNKRRYLWFSDADVAHVPTRFGASLHSQSEMISTSRP